jgi:hypothetical protein
LLSSVLCYLTSEAPTSVALVSVALISDLWLKKVSNSPSLA